MFLDSPASDWDLEKLSLLNTQYASTPPTTPTEASPEADVTDDVASADDEQVSFKEMLRNFFTPKSREKQAEGASEEVKTEEAADEFADVKLKESGSSEPKGDVKTGTDAEAETNKTFGDVMRRFFNIPEEQPEVSEDTAQEEAEAEQDGAAVEEEAEVAEKQEFVYQELNVQMQRTESRMGTARPTPIKFDPNDESRFVGDSDMVVSPGLQRTFGDKFLEFFNVPEPSVWEMLEEEQHKANMIDVPLTNEKPTSAEEEFDEGAGPSGTQEVANADETDAAAQQDEAQDDKSSEPPAEDAEPSFVDKFKAFFSRKQTGSYDVNPEQEGTSVDPPSDVIVAIKDSTRDVTQAVGAKVSKGGGVAKNLFNAQEVHTEETILEDGTLEGGSTTTTTTTRLLSKNEEARLQDDVAVRASENTTSTTTTRRRSTLSTCARAASPRRRPSARQC